MQGIPSWIQLAIAAIIGVASLGFFAKNSDLASNETKYYQTFAQSGDLQTLKADMNKRIDELDSKLNNRLDRIEDLILNSKEKK